MNSDIRALATLAAAVFYAALLCVALWPLCRRPLLRCVAFCRRRTIAAIVAAVFTGIAVHCGATKSTNGNDRAGGSWEVSRGGAETQGEDVALRDADPVEGPTNFSFTAYAVTPSNESFAAAWPEWMLPYGSRIELHEKLFSLTNGWAPVREYVVEPGQTNLCDTLSITNGHPVIAFKALYGDSISITFPGLPSVVDPATGRRLSVLVMSDGSAPVSLPVAVERSERPAEFPPSDPAFAADPFAHVDGLAYDPTNETVTADEPGVFTIATGDQLCLIVPKLSFGSPHSYLGETLRSGSSSGLMRGGNRNDDQNIIVPSYPLDEKCLWEGWHEGTETDHGCSCHAELDFGCDISSCTGIVSEVTVEDDTVIAKVFLGESLVWSNSCEHADHSSSGGRSDYLSSDECSSCGTCADGNCDAFDGPSAGSVRFRVSLGSPSEGHVSGFLWFDQDSVFLPAPSSFSLMARRDAHVSDNTAGGTRTVACSDRGGRTIAVSPIQNGVRLTVTFTATGAPDRTWEITRNGGAMRFRKFNAGGVLMSDASYAPSGEACSVTDNVSGLTEVKASTGDVLSWENNWSRTVETVSAFGSVTGNHVRVVSEVVGWDDYAVLRETERSERRADGTWVTSHASYWGDYGSRRNGQPRMVWGDDRAWSWANYDELGRETLRFDQRDGSAAPDDWEWYSMDELPGCDAFGTVTDYVPHAGDSCHTNDWDKARTVSRYVVSDGVATLIARTWTRYVHGVAANGWPTVSETTIRACSQAAGIDDPGNAVSTVVRYDDETSAVPYLLRGETISETDEDGVTETHSHTILSNTVVRTVVSRTKGGHEAKTREVRERDLAYGLTLYEATQLTADPSVEFGWRRHTYDSRRRLRFTQYDDGSSETNAYDCCRLLFRIDRGGAKTLYCSTPETSHLYHAEEEVYLSQLPRGNDYYYVGGNIAAFDNAFRVTQHYMDAFGRETNTVVRSDTVQWASTNASSTTTRWYRTSEQNDWPDGFFGLSERMDARGLTTTSRRYSTQAYDVAVSEERLPGAEMPDVVTTNVSFRGGGNLYVRVSSGHVATNRSFSMYCADGTRRDYSITESGDCGVVTNSAAIFDFLGRSALLHTPVSCVSNVYGGAASRVLYYADLASDVVATNLYDETGWHVGEVSRGVVAESWTRYGLSDGEWWRVEAQSVSHGVETNSLSETWTQLTGLSNPLRSRTRTYADGVLLGTSETSFDPETLDLTETSVSASGGMSVRKSRFGRTVEEATDAGTKWTYYDFFGWPFYVKRAQPGGNALKHRLYGYSDHGDMTDEGEFVSGSLGTVRWRAYGYDARGNRLVATNEIGNVVTRTYDAEGRVLSEGGDTYPLLFGYDSSGHRTSLSSFRAAGGSQFERDTTSWSFDAASGLCTAKTYADGSFATNTWTADGLPLRAVNPDESWTERVYDSNRRVVGQTSSDPSCDYGLSLDSFGRTVAASNDVARYAYALANCGIATNETATAGVKSFSVVRGVDPYGRITSVARDGMEDSISYNPMNGTIAAISNAEACVMYAYTSDLLDGGYTLTLADGARFTRTLVRGSNYQRGNVSSVVNVSPLSTNTFAYTYDALDRPVSRNSDVFAYNSRSEVASATVDGNTATYAYDGIGNLSESTWNDVSTAYSANNLNQCYYIWSSNGSAWIDHSVNGEPVRCGDHQFLYDAKSRLVAAGEWVFDEDRYLSGDYDYYDELYSFTPVVSNRYDYLNRRVQKITSAATHTYFYDGWMLIKEIVAGTNGTTDVIEYHWGKDLSGTIGGAGGVGGLLYLTVSNSSTPNSSTHQLYIPWYDAYGNIMGYWDAQGNVVAEYTYDAFGKLVSSSGPMADVFAFRYSTKYFDSETGLYYYGYRYYSPELMRWITRDPIEEEGGVNLYAMCGNNSVAQFDVFGLYELTIISDDTVESDALMWYLHSNVGNVIRSNIHSREHLLNVIRRENARHSSLVTVLNLSGHGLEFGSGVSFLNSPGFDVGESYNALRLLLARGATIRIWSCEAASTYKKCSGLKMAAEALDVAIYANTGDVAAGPDGGTFGRLVRGVAAWIVGEKEGEWMRFVPRPKIQSKGWTIGPRAFKIQKEERRVND